MSDRIITAEEARALREAATPVECPSCVFADRSRVLAATVEALHAELAELRATIAAERDARMDVWRAAYRRGHEHTVKGRFDDPDDAAVDDFAREAMRAADASVVPRD